MRLQRFILILSIISGLAAVYLLNAYMQRLPQAASPVTEASTVKAVVARQTIPAFTRLTEEMLEIKSLPLDALHPRAARDLSDVVGKIARYDIFLGEQVLSERVLDVDWGSRLSFRLPETMRAITVAINEVSGVGGYVSPGDRVDLLATFTNEEMLQETGTRPPLTRTLLQNLLVLTVGGNVEELEKAESLPGQTLTLAVTPEQAELIAFVHGRANLHFVLRSPVDEREIPLPGISMHEFAAKIGR